MVHGGCGFVREGRKCGSADRCKGAVGVLGSAALWRQAGGVGGLAASGRGVGSGNGSAGLGFRRTEEGVATSRGDMAAAAGGCGAGWGSGVLGVVANVPLGSKGL